MKKHKKDLTHRAFLRGYQAAIKERSISSCPYSTESNLGFQWCTGWRQGRVRQGASVCAGKLPPQVRLESSAAALSQQSFGRVAANGVQHR